jgi:hypothetical protein
MSREARGKWADPGKPFSPTVFMDGRWFVLQSNEVRGFFGQHRRVLSTIAVVTEINHRNLR